MTIGSFDHDYSQGPNPDFAVNILLLFFNIIYKKRFFLTIFMFIKFFG